MSVSYNWLNSNTVKRDFFLAIVSHMILNNTEVAAETRISLLQLTDWWSTVHGQHSREYKFI